MSQYKTGTVTVSGEYSVVIGAGTSWLAEVGIGDVFQKRGVNVLYPIASVDSNTQLTLQSNYAGSGEVGMLYTISRDFTPNLDLPEVNTGDVDWPFHITTALRLIDSYLMEHWLSTTDVSLAEDGDTTIYTVPADKNCILTKAIFVAGADAGTSTISIGQDGAETDWIGATQCDNLDAANDAIILQPVPSATPVTLKSYSAGTVIQIKVSNYAGGELNTLHLFGVLY